MDGEAGPIATLVNFACHATVLSGENLMLSAEFPGVACRLLQQQTGAPALYLQGACGNINPVWIKQDFESVERAGQIVGASALRVVTEFAPSAPDSAPTTSAGTSSPKSRCPAASLNPTSTPPAARSRSRYETSSPTKTTPPASNRSKRKPPNYLGQATSAAT